MNYTPGPWHYESGAVWANAGDSERDGAEAIAKRCHGDRRPTERDANMRLVAAAPELLEALRILRVQLGDYRDGDGAAKFHACNIADAAIAKATGDE